ncbi:unnamed protein product, partial [Brassica oleracea var. botrytis]
MLLANQVSCTDFNVFYPLIYVLCLFDSFTCSLWWKNGCWHRRIILISANNICSFFQTFISIKLLFMDKQ